MNRKERRRAAKSRASADAPHYARPPGPAGADEIIQQAVQLHQMGRLDEAEALYRRALAIEPRNADAVHFLGLVAHQKGDNEKAIELLTKAVAIDGQVAAYHSNLGEAYRALGRLEEAVASYRRALVLRADMTAARFGLGTALLETGSYEDAAAELAPLVRVEPEDADANLNLGVALAALGRHDKAIARFNNVVRLRPELAAGHFHLGMALHAKGELRDAYSALARAIELDPTITEAHHRIAQVLVALEFYDEGIAAFREATRQRPDSAAIMLELGEALRRYRHYADSIAIYERAQKLDPVSVEPLNGIGLNLLERGDFEGARRMFERALERDPRSADAHFNIGFSYQLQGRFEEASRWHEKAIALKPDHAAAHYNLAKSRKAGSGPEHMHEIAKMLELPTLSIEQRIALNFALANLHDEIGEHDAAFRAYKEANDLKKSKMPFKPEDFTAYVDRVIATFTPDLLAEMGEFGSPSELPVFIVGMPRSGTSLVEQIAASHPDVHGAGELDDLRRIAVALSARLGTSDTFPEVVRRLDPATTRAIAEQHIAELRKHSATASRITDKLPINFHRLGLAAILFPRARLVHCVRDPLDTCVSCYFQEFAHGQPFAYDLFHLGCFYRDYERLMAYWHKILPGKILDIPYEALVADQEGWSRKLIDFVGLPWDERCLAFYEKERLVRTASFWQVRQPIYTSSIGRWRHYAKHLGPLFEGLQMLPPAGGVPSGRGGENPKTRKGPAPLRKPARKR